MNNYCPSQDWNDWVEMNTDHLLELLCEALSTDGDTTKQWYLVQIAKMLGYDLDWEEFEEGIPP